jgi:hypothetical protein
VVVDAGPTGEGTFSFISFAASPIAVESEMDHTIPIGGNFNFLIDLGGPADGILIGLLRDASGLPFGPSFSLYDDGAHGDGAAGDGRFGSDDLAPPGIGLAYLWVEGSSGGTPFLRQEPVPYSFQPVSITGPARAANFGGGTPLEFQVTNHDAYTHCYWYSYAAPDGWWVDGLGGFFPIVCLNPGETFVETATAYMAAGYTNDLPSGTSGEITLSLTEWEQGQMSDSTSVVITRRRDPASIVFSHSTAPLPPGGYTRPIEVQVLDTQNVAVADGTWVFLNASDGVISPTLGLTQDGFVFAMFTSASAGTISVTAETLNTTTATTYLLVEGPAPAG